MAAHWFTARLFGTDCRLARIRGPSPRDDIYGSVGALRFFYAKP